MEYNDKLIKKMKVSNVNSNCNKNNWSEIEEKSKIKLPVDYKLFIDTYSSGCINDFLWVLTPFTTNENINLFTKGNILIEAYKTSKKEFPDDFQFSLFPDKHGLFPWGITDNGDELYWQVDTDENIWKIIIYQSRSCNYIEYNMGIIELFYKLYTKEIVCPFFPEDVFSDTL